MSNGISACNPNQFFTPPISNMNVNTSLITAPLDEWHPAHEISYSSYKTQINAGIGIGIFTGGITGGISIAIVAISAIGYEIWHHLKYAKSEHLHERLKKYNDRFSQEIKTHLSQLNSYQNELNELDSKSPQCAEDYATYEARKQELYEKLFHLAQEMRESTKKLADATDQEHLKKDRKKKLITKDEQKTFEQLHQLPEKLYPYLQEIIDKNPQLIAGSQFNVEYAKFKNIHDIIFNPKTSETERVDAQKQLDVLKKDLDQRLENLTRLSSEDLTLFQNNIRIQHDDAQFYSLPNSENLTTLQGLFKKDDPQEYLRKSILYQRKLNAQGKFEEAAGFVINWMNTLVPGASSQDVIQMGYIFIQTVQGLATGQSPATDPISSDTSTTATAATAAPTLTPAPTPTPSPTPEVDFQAFTQWCQDHKFSADYFSFSQWIMHQDWWKKHHMSITRLNNYKYKKELQNLFESLKTSQASTATPNPVPVAPSATTDPVAAESSTAAPSTDSATTHSDPTIPNEAAIPNPETIQYIIANVKSIRPKFVQWYREHPELHLDPAVDPAPEDCSTRESWTLFLGCLHDMDQNLSFEAADFYQKCARLESNPEWVKMGALCDISSLNWSDAKVKLKELPEEQAKVVRQHLSLIQYELGSAVSDAVSLVISVSRKHFLSQKGWIGKTATVLDTAAQVAADPIAQSLWLPFLVDYREDLRTVLPSLGRFSTAYVGLQAIENFGLLGHLFDYCYSDQPRNRRLARYYEGGLSLSLNMARIVKPWLTINQPASLYSFSNITHSALPLASISLSLMDPYLGPDSRAIMQTVLRTLAGIVGIDVLFSQRNMHVAGHVGKFLARKSNFQKAYDAVITTCEKIEAAAFKKALTVITIGYYSIKAVYNFPKTRGACTIEETNRLCSLGQYKAARDFLDKANDYFIGNGPFQEYAHCIEFLEAIPHLKPTKECRLNLDKLVKSVNDEVLTKFKNDDRYSGVFSSLQLYKTIAFLKVKDYEAVKAILSGETDSSINEQVASFILNQAQELSPQTADDYLATVERVGLFSDINDTMIITKTRELIAHQKKHPVLYSAQEVIEERLTAISALMQLIAPRKFLFDHYVILQFNQLCVQIDARNDRGTREVNALLQKMEPPFHTKLALYLINQAEALCADGKYVEAIHYLQRACVSLHPSQYADFNLLIDQYKNYISHRKDIPDLTLGNLENNILTRIRVIEAIIHPMRQNVEFSQLIRKLQLEIQQILIDTNTHAYANNLLGKLEPSIHSNLVFYLLLNARAILHEKGCREACQYLQKAHDSLNPSKFDGFQDLVVKYQRYITCQQEHPNSANLDQFTERLETIEAVAMHIENIAEFAPLYTDLQFEKLCLFIDRKRYGAANQILQKTETFIHEKLALYLISQAEILCVDKKYDDALDYLKKNRKSLELSEYANFNVLIDLYKKYIASQQATPILTRGADIAARIASIDALTQLLENSDKFSQLYRKLQFEKICHFVDTEKYAVANRHLDDMSPAIHRKLAFRLIHSATAHCDAREYELAREDFRKIQSLKLYKFPELTSLIAKYQRYISFYEETPANLEEVSGEIDRIIAQIANFPEFSQIKMKLRYEKLCIQIDAGNYKEANTLIEKTEIPTQMHLSFYIISRSEMILHEKGHDAASQYLSKASALGHFKYTALLTSYQDLLSRRQATPHFTASTPQTIIQHRIALIDTLVSLVEKMDKFSRLYSKLQFEKLNVLLDTDGDANAFLERIETPIQANIALHWLDQSESVFREKGCDAACQYLTKIGALSHFKYDDLTAKYKSYITYREASIQSRIDLIDSLASQIVQMDVYSPLNAKLQSEKLLIFVDTEKYTDADLLLENAKTSVHTNLAFHLIHQAETILREKGIDAACQTLSKAHIFTHFKYSHLISNYISHLTYRLTTPQLTAASPKIMIQNRLSFIETVSSEIEKMDKYSPVYSKLQFDKLNILIDTDSDANAFLEKIETPIQANIVIYLLDQSERILREKGYEATCQYLDKRSCFSHFKYNDLVSSYKSYISCRLTTPCLTPTSPTTMIQTRLDTIDAVASLIEKIDQATAFYQKFQIEKLVVMIEAGKYKDANALLEKLETSIHSSLALYLLNHAEAVFRENGFDAACQYLPQTSDLKHFKYYHLIVSYQSHLAHRQTTPFLTTASPQIIVQNQLDAIDAVSSVIARMDKSSPLYAGLQFEKLNVLVNTGLDANDLLETMEDSIQANVVLFLLNQAETILRDKSYNDASQYLSKMSAFSHFKYKDIVASYKNYIACREAAPSLTTASPQIIIQTRINMIDALASDVEKIDGSSSFCTNLQSEKLRVYVETGQYQDAKSLLEKLETPLHTDLAFYLLIRAETKLRERGYDAACQYLSADIFNHSIYNDLIDGYKKYIACRQSTPHLTGMSPQVLIQTRIDAIDAVLAPMEMINRTWPHYIELQSAKFFLLIDAGKYQDAKRIWTQQKLADKISAHDLSLRAAELINKCEKLIQTAGVDSVNSFISSIPNEMGLLEHKLVQEYFRVLSNNGSAPDTTLDKIQCIDRLLNTFTEFQLTVPDSLKHSLNEKKIRLYVKHAEIYKSNAQTEEASNAYRSALCLFPERKTPDEENWVRAILSQQSSLSRTG